MDRNSSSSGGSAGEADQDRVGAPTALQIATDKPRANLIADIVGHPKGAPTVEELDYTNPSLEVSEIRRHLEILQDEDIVEELVAEPGDRIQGFPYEFYRLTEYARTLFDQNGLFPENAWRRQYNYVRKTDDIAEIEAIDRPEAN